MAPHLFERPQHNLTLCGQPINVTVTSDKHTPQELAVVRHACDVIDRTKTHFAPLMRDVPWHPIPFFGSLASARLLTFGLNPSAGEFSTGRSWPTRLSAEALTDRLTGYFADDAIAPHHPWFRAWADALAALGVSYRDGAAHVDLSPRPTASARTFSADPGRSLFLDMLNVDAPIWIEAVNAAPNAKLILLAGSATGKYYINEFIHAELAEYGVSLSPRWKRGTGEGQTAFQTFVLSSGRRIPVFFCSSGPSKPAILVRAVSANAERLMQLFRDG